MSDKSLNEIAMNNLVLLQSLEKYYICESI